jgi:hypothetical protein
MNSGASWKAIPKPSRFTTTLSTDVDDLKALIHDKRKSILNDVDAADLDLWKVSAL